MKPNAAAYPVVSKHSGIVSTGVTKREYFAGLALQGLLAGDYGCDPKGLAADAVLHADELLKQLENTK